MELPFDQVLVPEWNKDWAAHGISSNQPVWPKNTPKHPKTPKTIRHIQKLSKLKIYNKNIKWSFHFTVTKALHLGSGSKDCWRWPGIGQTSGNPGPGRPGASRILWSSCSQPSSLRSGLFWWSSLLDQRCSCWRGLCRLDVSQPKDFYYKMTS